MVRIEEHKIIEILYTNWRGDMEKRRIIPERIYFSQTQWHSREQWVMDAYDVGKEGNRTFALKDIQAWLPQELQTVPQ